MDGPVITAFHMGDAPVLPAKFAGLPHQYSSITKEIRGLSSHGDSSPRE